MDPQEIKSFTIDQGRKYNGCREESTMVADSRWLSQAKYMKDKNPITF